MHLSRPINRGATTDELTDGQPALEIPRIRFSIDHVRGRLQVFIDRRVSLPLIHEPIADTELEAQLFHVPVERIEMLVMHHAGRHMHGIALIPIVALAADL
jgi:hypothetical protein